MADTRLSDLSAAGALAASDLFYVVQTPGSGGEKATGAQLLTLVGTTYVPLAGGTMTGALTISTGATTTLSADLSGYLRVGSVTTFEHKGLTAITGLLISSTSAYQFVRAYGFIDANAWASIGANSFGGTTGVGIAATSALQWSTVHAASGAVGVSLWMDAAAQLALRNGTTAQRMHIYGTYTDSSNLERLTLSTTAGTSVNITAETLGTGGDNLDIVLTPAGTGSVKIPVAGLALSGGNANFLLGTTGTSRLTFAGTLSVINKSASADLYFGESTDTGAYFFRGTGGVNVTGAFQVTEMTAPAAPSTNSVRIYAEDNGAGKTRLMALFATGSAVQIAVEP